MNLNNLEVDEVESVDVIAGEEIILQQMIEMLSEKGALSNIDKFFIQAMHDICSEASAEALADKFLEEFVKEYELKPAQIFVLLNTPTEIVAEALISLQLRAVQVIRENAPKYIDDFRQVVRSRLTEAN
jgi:excinuclease UvrABC nuclease subunit